MARTGCEISGAVSVADAVAVFRSLHGVVSGIDVESCEPGELAALTSGVRDGQQALDLLLIQIGVVAEHHAAQSRGRGAHGTLLGDGSKVCGRAARSEAARAKTATEMDKVRQAAAEGRIGAAQIDAITNAARGLSPEQRARLNSDGLMDAAETLPADLFARRVRDEADRIKGDHGLADTKAKQAASSWKHWTDGRTGTGRISAEFDPERYEAIVTAVEAHVTRLANDGGMSKTPNLAAEAAFQLLTGISKRSTGLPHISIVVDHETIANGPHCESVRETAAGQPLPPESVARLACDAVLQRVVLDGQRIPVDVGRRYRTATDAQWHALRAMYRTCAWKGCERPLAWCQAHHIHEWENGGSTDLCNLIPLCNQHHHAVHEGGWLVKLQPGSRTLDMVDPDGILWATAKPDRAASPISNPGRRMTESTSDRSRIRGRPARPAAP